MAAEVSASLLCHEPGGSCRTELRPHPWAGKRPEQGNALSREIPWQNSQERRKKPAGGAWTGAA